MKYIEEFRNADYAQSLIKVIASKANPSRYYRMMEFCGGHTHTIHRYGIPGLLPENIELIHGPGCPVCVLPITQIDRAIAIAFLPNVLLCSYGDMLRVPGSKQYSLLQAKARGAQVQMIYSVDDALRTAQLNPNQHIVFFAIGFETTTPPTAYAIKKAKQLNLSNFSVFCNHVLTPVAMESLLQAQDDSIRSNQLDGLIGPAHVSIIIGSNGYQHVSRNYQKPIVISGFEPLDVLHSILLLIEQINTGRHDVETQYTRAVTPEGNLISQSVISDVLELRSQFEWRGLGIIPDSALKIRSTYQEFDAEHRFQLPEIQSHEHRQCDCGLILKGIKKPKECQLFAKACTPENPLGACMVSSEGACAAVYAYGRD